jgi:hypothetical protein
MNIFSRATKLVIVLALAGSLGLAVQTFADSKHKKAGSRDDLPPFQLIINAAATVKDQKKFIATASTSADTFDFYIYASANDPKPGHYTKKSGGKVWLSHRKISPQPDMTSPGPQVTQSFNFTAKADLDAVVNAMN